MAEPTDAPIFCIEIIRVQGRANGVNDLNADNLFSLYWITWSLQTSGKPCVIFDLLQQEFTNSGTEERVSHLRGYYWRRVKALSIWMTSIIVRSPLNGVITRTLGGYSESLPWICELKTDPCRPIKRELEPYCVCGDLPFAIKIKFSR